MKVPISQIDIGERQRQDLGDLTDLDSMSELGQLNAIGVRKIGDRWGLVDGRRRLAKATALGWTEIECVDRGHLTESQKNEIELIEDIARKDRTWQEKCTAVAKLFRLKKAEKREIGENWTVRMMSAFTNEPRSSVHRMLQIGEELARDPNGEMSQCENYLGAIKLIYQRHEREVRAELESRRQGAAVAETNPTPIDDALVPEGDTTPEPGTTEITLYGTNGAFVSPGRYACVLGYNVLYTDIPAIAASLQPTGFALLWFDNHVAHLDACDQCEKNGLFVQPWPLVWHQVVTPQSTWPFGPSYALGLLASPTEPSVMVDSVTSVITCMQTEQNELPWQVVSSTLDTICPPNMPVLCVNNAPVLAIAETGRVPVFFEQDRERFEAKMTALETYYKEQVPGCVVRRKA